MKKINIGEVNMISCNNGTIKGFQLKRELTLREVKYIMGRLLGFSIFSRDDFETAKEYRKYNDQLLHDVTIWLHDDVVIAYLKKKQIID